MSEENIAELEAPKPKRKAPAKKAAVKKTAAKKTAKVKAAPAVEEVQEEKTPAVKAKAKVARKTPRKKTADAEAPELNLLEAAPAAAAPAIVETAPEPAIVAEAPAAPAPAPAPVAAAPVPQAAVAPAAAENASEADADDDEAEEAGAGTTPGTPGAENNGLSRYTVLDANGQPRPMTAKERRKAKFERWKQRRAERDSQRRSGRDHGAPNGNGGSPQSHGGQHYEPEPPLPLGPPEPANGILEMSPKGYGFLRRRELSFAQHPQDAFIAPEFIRKYGLREGMQVSGVQCKGARGPQITEVTEVNGRDPMAMRELPLFEELKAVNPNKRYQLETVKDRLTTRVIDMMTPVGRGQRGLIVAPPRAGKTTIMQHIAEAVLQNHPGTHLMILLVDERPEEVTEFKRVLPNAEIFASNNDQDVKSHTRISSFAIERAKRLVECGEHVFMLMDSITRMARAFNNIAKGGATGSGGLAVGALEIPRRLFAAARNTRTAGSLTILGTALVETGGRQDDVIFQEFKGTGNMELVLDRKIAEQYIYPAVNIFKSGTRREELLLQPFQLDKIHMLRRGLAGHKPVEAIQRVISLLERYPNNAQMLVDLPSKG
ncbi:transcription termination factor Rho [Prosthecobacter vanneervenii]|uniref:Transcription termination factor Rho n=1 Tax=Prosthecobacter vanneervenii TaxID=48466 RepID=A0A7W7Y7E8_9BACT|nr:transcription termination factor Rho [Prosthecobacter vanneervenii]MBB5030997.1 transcription termination factor Rho [Prosthecobacter vanneervenii]